MNNENKHLLGHQQLKWDGEYVLQVCLCVLSVCVNVYINWFEHRVILCHFLPVEVEHWVEGGVAGVQVEEEGEAEAYLASDT